MKAPDLWDDQFSPREVDVLEAVREGARTYGAIATDLAISPRTAEAHVRSIARRLEGRPGLHGPPLIVVIVYVFTRERGLL